MALLLRVTNDAARRLGDAYTHVIAEGEARIGRRASNDWVLPDADLYVSSEHACVRLVGGRWILTDHSTNGTFVNAGSEPLGKGNETVLSDFDRLRIGHYEILVRIVA